ncbi:MAG: (2Fe-2S)-binding protein [Planctomycetota bacterium]
MARTTLHLEINGDPYEVSTFPWRTLAEVLREDLNLVGTKIGCGTGDCGACTVLLDGKAVCSCLTLAADAEGRRITTIEGLAPSPTELHPVQRAFIAKGAVQCGFCTPGMILRAVELLAANPSPTEAEIRAGFGGNLCRCTGYNKIVAAIQAAAAELELAAGRPS